MLIILVSGRRQLRAAVLRARGHGRREDEGRAGSFEHIVCHRRTEEGQDLLHLDPRSEEGERD